MKKTLLATLLALPMTVSASDETVYLHYDNTLDGVIDYQENLQLKMDLSGNTIIGKTQSGEMVSGMVENKNSHYIGSGEKERFQFEIHNGETRNWFVGNVSNEHWTGNWFGPNGEKGDFTLTTRVLTDDIPTYSDIASFMPDEVFYKPNSHANVLTDSFLQDVGGLEPHFTNSGDFNLNLSQGLYLQAEEEYYHEMPMSFTMDFKEPMRLKTFRLGSANLTDGTRLKTFSFSIWNRMTMEWEEAGRFEFPQIYGPSYQRQEFTLPRTVYADRIRISAHSSHDTSNGKNKVLMWGLSFQR